jgi:hypothetical protein
LSRMSSARPSAAGSAAPRSPAIRPRMRNSNAWLPAPGRDSPSARTPISSASRTRRDNRAAHAPAARRSRPARAAGQRPGAGSGARPVTVPVGLMRLLIVPSGRRRRRRWR